MPAFTQTNITLSIQMDLMRFGFNKLGKGSINSASRFNALACFHVSFSLHSVEEQVYALALAKCTTVANDLL